MSSPVGHFGGGQFPEGCAVTVETGSARTRATAATAIFMPRLSFTNGGVAGSKPSQGRNEWRRRESNPRKVSIGGSFVLCSTGEAFALRLPLLGCGTCHDPSPTTRAIVAPHGARVRA